jgi:SAM-dependent methyltransferase
MSDYALTMSDAEIRRYLMMAERARESEADLWATAGIGEGVTVADIGCGPAATTAVLAAAVGPNGHVTGVEPDESALAAGRQLIAQAHLANVTLQQGNAESSGLAPGSFDVVMMRHVLAHNQASEQQIVDALAALVKPGGCVYLMDIEGTASRLQDLDPALADLMERYAEFHRRRGNDLQAGLRLGKLLTAAGLELVVHRGWYQIMTPPPGVRPPPWAAREAMLAAGVVTQDDVERWSDALDRMDADAKKPTIFMPQFVAVGRKP